jgi:hypothetical protein
MKADRRAILAAAGLAMLGAAGAAGIGNPVRRARTNPKVRCDLPSHDYVYGNPPRNARAFSDPVVLVRAAGPPRGPAPAGAVAYAHFQLAQPSIAVDHCSISAVVLTLWNSGHWSLDFDARQNAEDGPAAPRILPGSTGPQRFTDYIKRNLFAVRVRGLGFADGEIVMAARLGRPVLFTLAPEPFWVQRRVPISPSLLGRDPRVASAFNVVDRVDVELSYQ